MDLQVHGFYRNYSLMHDFSKICILGLGYVGLPTAVIFANQGINVIGVDIDPNIVKLVNSGKTALIEPNLSALLSQVVKKGTFRGALNPISADVFILAVPTPCDDKNIPDLSYLEAAADSIAPYLKIKNLVIIESTVPIGATENITSRLAKARPDLTFPDMKGDLIEVHVAHSPERVLPGNILQEIENNDRVIGGMTDECGKLTAELYKLVTNGQLFQTHARAAEMIKLSENAFRDVNIAFANELSQVAEKLDIDIWEVIKLANKHPRVDILKPGPGVGGHCIAVDPWFIANSAPNHTPLIQTSRAVNNSMPKQIVKRIMKVLPSSNAAVSCLGLTYKGNIDDLRQSPAIMVVQELLKSIKGKIFVAEPHIKILPPTLENEERVSLVDTETAVNFSNVIVLLTDHTEFITYQNKIPEEKIKIDTRGVWNK